MARLFIAIDPLRIRGGITSSVAKGVTCEILQTSSNELENQTIGDESIEKHTERILLSTNYNNSGFIVPQGTDLDTVGGSPKEIECSVPIAAMLLYGHSFGSCYMQSSKTHISFIAQQERQENQYCCTRALDSVEGFDSLLS